MSDSTTTPVPNILTIGALVQVQAEILDVRKYDWKARSLSDRIAAMARTLPPPTPEAKALLDGLYIDSWHPLNPLLRRRKAGVAGIVLGQTPDKLNGLWLVAHRIPGRSEQHDVAVYAAHELISRIVPHEDVDISAQFGFALTVLSLAAHAALDMRRQVEEVESAMKHVATLLQTSAYAAQALGPMSGPTGHLPWVNAEILSAYTTEGADPHGWTYQAEQMADTARLAGDVLEDYADKLWRTLYHAHDMLRGLMENDLKERGTPR